MAAGRVGLRAAARAHSVQNRGQNRDGPARNPTAAVAQNPVDGDFVGGVCRAGSQTVCDAADAAEPETEAGGEGNFAGPVFECPAVRAGQKSGARLFQASRGFSAAQLENRVHEKHAAAVSVEGFAKQVAGAETVVQHQKLAAQRQRADLLAKVDDGENGGEKSESRFDGERIFPHPLLRLEQNSQNAENDFLRRTHSERISENAGFEKKFAESGFWLKFCEKLEACFEEIDEWRFWELEGEFGFCGDEQGEIAEEVRWFEVICGVLDFICCL